MDLHLIRTMLISVVDEHLILLVYVTELTRYLFHLLILLLQNILQFIVSSHLLYIFTFVS